MFWQAQHERPIIFINLATSPAAYSTAAQSPPIVELSAFGQQGPLEQQIGPVGEAVFAGFTVEPREQGVVWVDFKRGLDAGRSLARNFSQMACV